MFNYLMHLSQVNTLKAKLTRTSDEAASLKEELSETKQKLNKVHTCM